MSVTEIASAEDRLADELQDYEGEWVAVRDHKVVERAGTLHELLALTKERRLAVDTCFEVVADDDTICLF